MPKDRTIDGRNLLPLWQDLKADWPDRSLFIQWHRGDVPEMYRACAVRDQRWRLVQPNGIVEKTKFDKAKWLLFDVEKDPYETKDLAGETPDVVVSLKKRYELWFKDVESTRQFKPPLIVIGSDKENPTILTRQDWRSKDGNWTPKSLGHWDLRVEKSGEFEFTATMATAAAKGGVVNLRVGTRKFSSVIDQDTKAATFRNIDLPAGPAQLEAWVVEGETNRGMRYVEVRRIK